jgi:hypothetical protein
MNPRDKDTFMAWHQGMRDCDYVFNSQEEILLYFQSDVYILHCLRLSFCVSYLPKDSIAVIAPMGYSQKTSNRCLPINGHRTQPKRTKRIFSMLVMAERNVLFPICWMGITKKVIWLNINLMVGVWEKWERI